MGGVKKKSLASMEKQQESQDAGHAQAAPTPKGKKVKEQKAAPQQKKQFAFLPPKLSEADLLKSLTQLKAITVYNASRALGVNASIAAGVLRDLESKTLIRKAGGFSGHSIWAVAQKT